MGHPGRDALERLVHLRPPTELLGSLIGAKRRRFLERRLRRNARQLLTHARTPPSSMMSFVLESADMALHDRPEKVGRLVLRDVRRTRSDQYPGHVFIAPPRSVVAPFESTR